MAFTSSYTPGLIQQSEYIYATPNITIPGNISGSITSTASFGTYLGDGSQLTGVVSASYALTASHALNAGGSVPAGTVSGSAQITALGFVTSSATASFVLNSQTSSMSVATASYVETSQTASYVLQAVSASFATSASYAPSADAFPFVGDAVITGSLILSGSNPLLQIPDGPQDAVVISGSNDRTRLHIYDTEDNLSPVYTEGAGIVLTGGEGSAQSILEMSAVGSNNGGSNNEQTFIRSSETLTITAAAASTGQNILFRGTAWGMNFNSSNAGTELVFITNGGATRSTIALGTTSGTATDGVALSAPSSGNNFTIVAGGNTWLDMSSTKATFIADVSSSATSTASFGTYIGDGSQLTNLPAAISSSYALTASYIETAQTASYVLNAVSSSYSSFAVSASYSTTASHALTSVSASYAVTASHALNAGGGTPTFIASGSTSASAAPDTGVVVEHSGSTAFSVIGDVGTSFSVDDDLNGMLFTANDISGFPVLQASASGEVYVGKTPQSLYTTAVISSTTAATTHSLCTLSTSSYDGGFFEYTAHSASNARAGNIMSTWNGSNIVYAETTTTDIGDTSDLTTQVIISGSTARLVAYGANAGYKIKTIIKAI